MTTVTDAAYSWWVHPEALTEPGGTTWFVSITRDGVNRLHRLVADAETATVVLPWADEDPDDHNGGSVVADPARPERPLLVFATRHNLDRYVRYRTVQRDGLVAGPELHVGFSKPCTYSQVWVHDSRVWLWVRTPVGEWKMRWSDDWGETWGPERTMFVHDPSVTSGQLYATSWLDGATLHWALTGHPTSSSWHHVTYCRARLDTGLVTSHDGQVLGTLDDVDGPTVLSSQATFVHTAPADRTTRLLGITVVDGLPTITIGTWPTADPPADGADLELLQATRPYGGEWRRHQFGHSGPAFGYTYIGGAVADPVSGDVWVARNGDEAAIERHHGPRWGSVDVVETSTDVGLARPYVPVGVDGQLVLYQRIRDYQFFTDYLIDTAVWRRTSTVDQPAPARRPATLTQQVTWLSVDATTGDVIDELPVQSGRVARTLMAYETTNLAVAAPVGGPLSIAQATLESATTPARRMVVAVVNDVPMWAGLIVRREGGTAATWKLSCVTPEGYMARRYVTDHRFDQADSCATVLAALLRDADDIDGVGAGLPWRYDIAPSGRLIDRTYLTSQQTTV